MVQAWLGSAAGAAGLGRSLGRVAPTGLCRCCGRGDVECEPSWQPPESQPRTSLAVPLLAFDAPTAWGRLLKLATSIEPTEYRIQVGGAVFLELRRWVTRMS